MINWQMYSLNSNPGISSTFLSSFLVPKKVCKSFTSRCVFCNVALFSCSAIKLSTEPTSTNLPDILKIKRRLASFRAKDDKACRTTTFHLWKTSFVQSDAANDDFSLAKFHRSRRWLAATKSRAIFSSLSSVWINLSTYKIKWQFWFCHRASRSKTYFKVPGWCIWHKQMCYLSARQNNAYEEQRSNIKRTLKVLLRSKFNVKFVTKTLSFQLIRSGCTFFGHWSELGRPLSENIELENVGFSRPPLQIYVPVTKLLFSDCDVIFWTRKENKPEPWENSERFSKLRSSSPDSGIVKEEIIDYDDSVGPAPTEYEKVKY